jgi:peptidylprolyl isomerase
MLSAQHGDTVKVDYVGMLDDGTVVESTVDKFPLQFTLGSGQVIPGFDEAVLGMTLGEEKTCRILTEKAFGRPRKEMTVVINRDQVPIRVTPRVGDPVEIYDEPEPAVVATVTDVSESTLTLDLNHPLAGQDLTVALKLLEIVEPASEPIWQTYGETRNGRVAA